MVKFSRSKNYALKKAKGGVRRWRMVKKKSLLLPETKERLDKWWKENG